jgi:hypothetical protein
MTCILPLNWELFFLYCTTEYSMPCISSLNWTRDNGVENTAMLCKTLIEGGDCCGGGGGG